MGFFVIISLLTLPVSLLVLLLAMCTGCCCGKRLRRRLLFWVIRMLLPFRYDIRIRGMKSIPKDQGVLFLPNHPALIDPPILMSYLSTRFRVRPVAAKTQVKRPGVHLSEPLQVPEFQDGTNSYTKHLMEQLLNTIVSTLECGDSILLYPAGRLMRSGQPFVELGASAVFDILSKRNDKKPWRVVLVSTNGLWGSRFSYAYDLKVFPNAFAGFKRGLCDLLCNLILFMPKRRVDIHMETIDVPVFKDKLELNQWLQSWYEKTGGLVEELIKPGEPGYVKGKGLVPTCCCCKGCRMREPDTGNGQRNSDAAPIGLNIAPEVIESVQRKLAKHLGCSIDNLGLGQSLAFDLGLDSIQLGELAGWLDEEFDAQDVSITELSDVASVVRVAAGERQVTAGPSTGRAPPKGWLEKKSRRPLQYPLLGQNLAEAFIRNAKRLGGDVAVGDDRSGVLDYNRLLIVSILTADFLIAHPERCEGGRVGVMMPAAAGVGLLLMAIMMAGCTPVMVNWTVGRASLEHVVKSTGIKTVITSKAFLQKLGPEVDLTCLLEREGILLFSEDLKENKFGGFGLLQKLKGKLRARKSADAIVKRYKLNRLTPDHEAVVLFTSGSESVPKGVPLTHVNVMTNIDSVLQHAAADNNDCLLGTLPPFHSFGFTITTVGPLVSGLKGCYYPNPTEYRRIAKEVARWQPTLYLGTPTFVNGMLQAAWDDRQKTIEKDKTASSSSAAKTNGTTIVKVVPVDSLPWATASLRLCVTGAEKTPDDLFNLAASFEPPISIIEGYGITETSPVLTANRPGKPRAGVGYVIKGTSLGLLEEEPYLRKEFKMFATCTDGKVDGPTSKRGVIVASGPNVFGAPDAVPPRAYLGIPLSEKNPFIHLNNKWWYDTGDLGYLDDTGALHLAGRLKRFVKIAGEMISLVALEAALKERTSADGTRPWADKNADGITGPVVAVEAYEPDGEKPILAIVSAVEATLDDANAQLREAGMPKIAKLTLILDAGSCFEERWAEQGTLPLLGTGKTDYASIKRAVVAAAQAGSTVT